MLEVIVHYPQTNENIIELRKRAAILHAHAVTQYIDHLSCPKEQKLKLYNEIVKACRN